MGRIARSRTAGLRCFVAGVGCAAPFVWLEVPLGIDAEVKLEAEETASFVPDSDPDSFSFSRPRLRCKNELVTKERVAEDGDGRTGLLLEAEEEGWDVSGVEVAEVDVEADELAELLELEELSEDEPDVGIASSVPVAGVRFQLDAVLFKGESCFSSPLTGSFARASLRGGCFSFGLEKAGK